MGRTYELSNRITGSFRLQQQKDKVRIFALARELNMESKDLVVLCKQHGIDVKSQLSTIEPEVRDQIVDLVKRGPATPAQPAKPQAAAPIAPPPSRHVRVLDTPRRAAQPRTEATKPSTAAPTAGSGTPSVTPVPTPPPTAPAVAQAPAGPAARTPEPAAPVPPAAVTPPAPAAPTPAGTPPARPAAKSAPTPPAPAGLTPEKPVIPADKTPAPTPQASTPPAKQPDHPAPRPPEQPAAGKPAEPAAPPRAPEPTRSPEQRPPAPATPTRPAAGQAPPAEPARPPAGGPGNVPNLTRPMRTLTPTPRPGGGASSGGQQGGRPGGAGGAGGSAIRPQRQPGGGGSRVAPPTQGTKPPAKPPAKQPDHGGARKIMDISPELMAKMQGRDTPLNPTEIEERMKRLSTPPGRGGAAPQTPVVPPPGAFDDDEESAAKRRHGAGGVAGRAERHKERNERQAKRKLQGEEPKGGKISTTALLDDEGPRHRKDRRHHKPKPKQPTEERKGKIPLSLPITVRSLSEAIGKKSNEVLATMIAHGAEMGAININSSVDPEMAELVALDFGREVEIKRNVDQEQVLIDSHKQGDKEEDLVPRAPVVTIMGHVDHGKTSLLDRIRHSNVVDTEAGGITQVIRAWRVEHNGKPITFLDTPGHEAFTKMRARGANVTDIAVIVVAANDGVMPQTEEAISHAKAAEVSIVVAVNKVDLPDANIKKTEQQLYSLGLIPDTMGGEVPFVYTSAKSGKGIDELLGALSIVAELKELKANPNKPASGTCLEAHLSEKEGVFATILVQDGTLRPGDVVLCGATYGTIRRMYDDRNRPIEEAGPSVPVRITGLDDVPNADDPFLVVQDLTVAREIAETRKQRDHEKSLVKRVQPSFETKPVEIAELKVILKAEARGSVEAIKAELEKLQHEEVRVRILHTGIGAITVSDVQLAMTSPDDTLIVGFNVVPDNDAKSLAEERGIQIREYDIIFNLSKDIRLALEGKLKPREDVIHLGRAVVRETFKISRVGTIAGCYVTQGVIERSGKIRVIRSGVVVYPPSDRSVGLDSLKRFKEDVREVREGFECGIKISGYDDIKVDDVIECYRIEQVARKLS
jgi:translation initiation factor IF-2